MGCERQIGDEAHGQGVAVRGPVLDGHDADGRASAWPVFDDDRLAHDRAQLLGERARDGVGGGARWIRDDEADRFRRISGLRGSPERKQCAEDYAAQQYAAACDDRHVLLFFSCLRLKVYRSPSRRSPSYSAVLFCKK